MHALRLNELIIYLRSRQSIFPNGTQNSFTFTTLLPLCDRKISNLLSSKYIYPYTLYHLNRLFRRWAHDQRHFLQNRSSPLEFYLHRSQYMRLLLSSDISQAQAYARATFPPFYSEHATDIKRLMTCMLYLPLTRLQTSPYADFASPSLHSDLEPLFAKEYCASLGMSRQVPLRVVGDIGGGGALARIEKGRKVMRERKSEWSQSDELPVEWNLSLLSCGFLYLGWARLRSRCLQRIDITLSLPAPCRRSSPRNRTLR